jgi:hypothetical protein
LPRKTDRSTSSALLRSPQTSRFGAFWGRCRDSDGEGEVEMSRCVFGYLNSRNEDDELPFLTDEGGMYEKYVSQVYLNRVGRHVSAMRRIGLDVVNGILVSAVTLRSGAIKFNVLTMSDGIVECDEVIGTPDAV